MLSVDLVLGDSFGGGTGNKSVTAFENVAAGSWEVDQVVLRGDGGSNRLNVAYANHGAIFGGRGDDKLAGHYFADLLVGGDGNDLLAGGGNDDRLYGGRGLDTATFSRNASSGDYVEASLLTGLAYFYSGSTTQGIARIRDIENLEGAPGDDSLIGNGRDNSLAGLGGNDSCWVIEATINFWGRAEPIV